jgi:hypothetical protein
MMPGDDTTSAGHYFRHAVANNIFSMLDNFAWWRVIRMLRERHHWRWQDVRATISALPPSGCTPRPITGTPWLNSADATISGTITNGDILTCGGARDWAQARDSAEALTHD